VTAPLIWMVLWVDGRGRGIGRCEHRHSDADAATACPFEPAKLPDVCAGLVCQVRDPEYLSTRERRRARQLELEFGVD